MHAFVAFLLRQRWFVAAATALLCVAGAVAWTRLPPARGYLVVYANGPDGTSGYHAGFNLNKLGGSL